jgi:hypothetical protein
VIALWPNIHIRVGLCHLHRLALLDHSGLLRPRHILPLSQSPVAGVDFVLAMGVDICLAWCGGRAGEGHLEQLVNQSPSSCRLQRLQPAFMAFRVGCWHHPYVLSQKAWGQTAGRESRTSIMIGKQPALLLFKIAWPSRLGLKLRVSIVLVAYINWDYPLHLCSGVRSLAAQFVHGQSE